MLMVASELATGCILTPEIGAMYGPNNTSEAAQAERIVDRLPSNALVLADSAFGIFRVAYRCHSLGKEFVFRLTSDRFRSYQKKSTLVESGPGFSTWRFQWSPSLKELLGSVIAYHLVAQFRRQAAKLAKITPRRLSFKGVWLSFTCHRLYAWAEALAEWEKIYTTALISASRRRLPNRPKPRSHRVLPTLVAPKPPGLRRRSAETNDKYPTHDEKQVALGLRPSAFILRPNRSDCG